MASTQFQRKTRVLILGPATTDVESLNASGVDGYVVTPPSARALAIQGYARYCAEVQVAARDRAVIAQLTTTADLTRACEEASRFAGQGDNAWVGVPVIDSVGEWNVRLINHLQKHGIRVAVLNVTCPTQVNYLLSSLETNNAALALHVATGAIYDSNRDSIALFRAIQDLADSAKHLSAAWSGVRSVGDVQRAWGYSDVVVVPTSVYERMGQEFALAAVNLNTVARKLTQAQEDCAESGGYRL